MGRLIAKNDAMKDLEKKISPPTVVMKTRSCTDLPNVIPSQRNVEQ